jgi:hypothetical protein
MVKHTKQREIIYRAQQRNKNDKVAGVGSWRSATHRIMDKLIMPLRAAWRRRADVVLVLLVEQW